MNALNIALTGDYILLANKKKYHGYLAFSARIVNVLTTVSEACSSINYFFRCAVSQLTFALLFVVKESLRCV